jgi:hypothetical protein
LQTKGVYAGPVDGVLSAQTAPALSVYQNDRACLSSARQIRSPDMAMTSFALVGNSADSPESILRPSPATDHDAEKLEV